MGKVYIAVSIGYDPDIYEGWSVAKFQVLEYPGATYKGFDTFEEAEEWMNDQERRARRERHLRDRSPALIARFLERRDRNPRYKKWLQRNGLEPGSHNPFKVEKGIKPDPVKVKEGIKRETGLFMEQQLEGVDDGYSLTITRAGTGYRFQTTDWLDTPLRTSYITSSSPQSCSGSSCRHESNSTSQSPVSLQSWLKSRNVSTPSSSSPAQSRSLVAPRSDATPERPSGSDSAGVSSPAALPRLTSEGPDRSQENVIDFVDLGPGSRDDPFIISDSEDSDTE